MGLKFATFRVYRVEVRGPLTDLTVDTPTFELMCWLCLKSNGFYCRTFGEGVCTTFLSIGWFVLVIPMILVWIILALIIALTAGLMCPYLVCCTENGLGDQCSYAAKMITDHPCSLTRWWFKLAKSKEEPKPSDPPSDGGV